MKSDQITVHYSAPGTNKPLCGHSENGLATSASAKYVNCGSCIQRVMTGFADLDVDYRKRLVLAMRREGVKDAVTARVLGVTKERIRQIGGNITQDENFEATKWGLAKDKVDEFLKDVREGVEPTLLSPRYGLKNPQVVLDVIRRLGAWEDYRKGKQTARYRKLKDRLREFGEAWREKNGTNEYRTCDLLAYDTSLYGLIARSGFLVEWSRELGLVYVTGEQRLRNGRGDGVDSLTDERFEMRRRI